MILALIDRRLTRWWSPPGRQECDQEAGQWDEQQGGGFSCDGGRSQMETD